MSDDYHHLRQRLERQLRADVELLFEAYRAKLRALETVARVRGEIEGGDLLPPLELPAGLPPAGDPGPRPGPVAPAAPARRRFYVVHEAVGAALERLGETFDRRDLCREMGFEPTRATLHRVLQELQDAGVLAIDQRGSGSTPTVYRKLGPTN